MSKNLIILFIIILLIVGGFGIYSYDQSNQAKKEVEEKNLKLESNDKIISKLQENIQEKEKQINELKANLAEGKKDIEKEYANKLSEITEEKAKLEALLAEKERIWLNKEKEKQQLIIKLEEEVAGYKESISKLDNELVNLKEEIDQLTEENKDLEKEYADKLSEITEEKVKLEVLLSEKEETIKTIKQQKEESEQIVFSKNELISKLQENIQEKEKQINELKANLAEENKDLEKEYADKLSEITEEKVKLEVLLSEQKEILQTKNREKEELISKLENCNNQIKELRDKLAQKETKEEKYYVAELSALREEKSKLETQLKASQDLLLERENAIALIKQKNEESGKNIVEKDKTIAELSESIRGYENQVKEIQEQMAQEKEKGIEKGTEYSNKLSLLREEKSKLETQLKASQDLLSEKEDTIVLINQRNEESGKNIVEKDKTIAELSESIRGYENQVKEIQEQMAQEKEKGIEKGTEYSNKLSLLREEKSKLETQLKASQDLLSEKEDTIVLIKQRNEESGKNIVEKDKTIAELSESIRGYENQVKEIQEQMAQEKEKGIEKGTEYSNKLSLLREEKSKLETQLKASQDLLLEREDTIALIKQKNEESGKNIVEKDKTIAELSESIRGYENQVKEIQEQMAQEGKEKEAEYADKLALLKENKSIVEAKLAEAIKKSIPDYYEVKKGDSLWKIAERFYSTGEKWVRIFEANVDKINNPDIIYPYQRFTIPKE